MLWYKLKTWYGGEEALVKEIRRAVPPYLYEDVFVIYNERNLRRQRQSVIETEPLFKGCVFLTCRETEPLLRRLDQIPAVSRLIGTGYLSMFPLMERDARFLELISGPEHVVRVSYVLRESEEGNTYRVCGPLEYLLDGLEKIRFSSRFAKTHKQLWGEDTVLPLGILAKEDLGEKILNRGAEEVPELPEAGHYTLLEIDKDEAGRNVYHAGSSVTLLPSGERAVQAKAGAAAGYQTGPRKQPAAGKAAAAM